MTLELRHVCRRFSGIAAPTLEGIFQQLAVEQDTTAISREIANLIES
jgi:hypothetical protein